MPIPRFFGRAWILLVLLRRGLARFTVALAAVALIAAACGDDDDEPAAKRPAQEKRRRSWPRLRRTRSLPISSPHRRLNSV